MERVDGRSDSDGFFLVSLGSSSNNVLLGWLGLTYGWQKEKRGKRHVSRFHEKYLSHLQRFQGDPVYIDLVLQKPFTLSKSPFMLYFQLFK